MHWVWAQWTLQQGLKERKLQQGLKKKRKLQQGLKNENYNETAPPQKWKLQQSLKKKENYNKA